MKKLVMSVSIIWCIMGISSCMPKVKHDRSLTGSISYEYVAKIEGTFDGTTLISYGNYHYINIEKVSDTEVSLWLSSIWQIMEDKLKTFVIDIPELPVSGKPYDVNFDYISRDTIVRYDDDISSDEFVEYHSVRTSISGWMKEETGTWGETRSTPATPHYICDITIDCTIDGKELSLRITELY